MLNEQDHHRNLTIRLDTPFGTLLQATFHTRCRLHRALWCHEQRSPSLFLASDHDERQAAEQQKASLERPHAAIHVKSIPEHLPHDGRQIAQRLAAVSRERGPVHERQPLWLKIGQSVEDRLRQRRVGIGVRKRALLTIDQ